MPMRCSCGIYDAGFCLYPWSDNFSTHGTGSNTDTRMAAYPFHLPSVRQSVDIQDAMFFSKPDGSLHGCPIPFETLQIDILLGRERGQVLVRHSHVFLVDVGQ